MVEVDVTNTGKRAGDEVVQIYMRDAVSSAAVDHGIAGLSAHDAEPSERRTLGFEVGPDAFAFWNIHMQYVVEPGIFTIYAEASSVATKTVKPTVTA